MDKRYSSQSEMARNKKLGYSKRLYIYDQVKETFRNDNVEIIKGAIPTTLNYVKIEKICFLSVDMNSVKPEIDSLNYFWDKLVSGGMIVLDDYGYPGCIDQKHAHDKFAESKKIQIL